ncbi:hypothetical protein, partial [Microcystis sp.]|uniref:hypothetical protein n=1 Tax=Microcystis sp. TaxID=1127 RepID=UPI003919950B
PSYVNFSFNSSIDIVWLFGLCYVMDEGYKGCNPYIERHLAIFVNCFCLERTNQLSLLPDKDLVDLCPPIEPYQVTKNRTYQGKFS